MMFDRTRVVIPKGARVLKTKIKTDFDVIISDKSEVNKSIESQARVFVGELVKLKGSITAEEDVRVDRLTTVTKNITGAKNVYIGERSKIGGKLIVENDLDIGENVEVGADNIQAKGWVNIRNPLPMIIYLFIYIMELLRRGEGEEVQRILEELDAQNMEDFIISGDFLFIPTRTQVNKNGIITKGRVNIGEETLIKTNVNAGDDIIVDEKSRIVGNLETKGQVLLNAKVEIEGDIRCGGDMEIGQEVMVHGDIYCNSLKMYNDAKVDGKINAKGKIKLLKVEELADELPSPFDAHLDELPS
jgi:predicted acyltransferase (DUF342 family)